MQPDFNALFIVLLTTIIGLLAWALMKLIGIDNAMAKITTWSEGHEKLDDERSVTVNKALDQIWRRLDEEQYGTGRKG